MAHITGKNQNSVLTPIVVIDIIMHTFFYWARILMFLTARLIAIVSPRIVDLPNTKASDFFLIIVINFFLLFLVLCAVITGNIFKYYLAVLFMFHNSILTIFTLAVPLDSVFTAEWILDGLVTFSYFFEGCLSLWIAFLRRNTFNINLFKKIGLNDKVNNAFGVRKCLETLGLINMFLAVVISIEFLTPKTLEFRIIPPLSLGYTFLTIVQQLFISIKFNEEIKWMRKIAIALGFLKLPIPVVMIIFRKNTIGRDEDEVANSFLYFLFADLILITVALIYNLFLDIKYFGSGLKDYLRIRTKRINLSKNL